MGEGRWHAPQPEGMLTYFEFHVDDIAYNLHHSDGPLKSSTAALADVTP